MMSFKCKNVFLFMVKNSPKHIAWIDKSQDGGKKLGLNKALLKQAQLTLAHTGSVPSWQSGMAALRMSDPRQETARGTLRSAHADHTRAALKHRRDPRCSKKTRKVKSQKRGEVMFW